MIQFSILKFSRTIRNFQSIIESAHTACFNSLQRMENHFVKLTDMIEREAQRPQKNLLMSRYACYFIAGLNAHFTESRKLEATLCSNFERLGHAH